MARNVVVEDILSPRGAGTAERAIRTVTAGDDTSLAQASALADYIRLLLIEQRLTNFILGQALIPVLDLETIRNDLQREI